MSFARSPKGGQCHGFDGLSPLRYIKRLGFGKRAALWFVDLIIRWDRVGLITEKGLMSFCLCDH